MIYIVTNDTSLAQTFNPISAVHIRSISDIPNKSTERVRAVIFDENLSVKESDVSHIRQSYPDSFISIYDPTSITKPQFRMLAFDLGANQVGYDVATIIETISEDVIRRDESRNSTRGYTCPYCGLRNLSEDDLWRHFPAYHINSSPDKYSMHNEVCPICNKELSYRQPLQVHIHEKHGPRFRSMSNSEARDKWLPNQLYNFSLVVCRHPITGRYLLCQEFSNQGFWLPGGAVDAGEGLTTAAHRECMEEAGIEIELKGILAIEYHPCGKQTSSNGNSSHLVRMRVIFFAEPTEPYLNRNPKSRPDFESAGACWCSESDICDGALKLRGNEPRQWVKYLQGGGAVYPLELLIEKEC